MTDQSSVDGILEFLRNNRFSQAEDALRHELSNRSDINGFLQKLKLEDKDSNEKELRRSGSRDSEVSKELIVKEVDCGTSTNGSVIKWENGPAADKPSKKETVVSTEMSFTFSKNSGDAAALDAHSYKFTSGNGTLEPYRNIDDNSSSLVDSYAFEQSRHGNLADIDKKIVETGEDIVFFGNKSTLWSGNSTKGNSSKGNSGSKIKETNEIDRLVENSEKHDSYKGSILLRTEDVVDTSENWKECSVDTLFQSSRGDASTSYNLVSSLNKREGKKKADISDVRVAIKEQESEVARALFFGKSQSTFDDKNISSLGLPLVYDTRKEEFPRLPPVKLKSEDNPLSLHGEEKFERDGSGPRLINDEEALLIGSYLDVPIGQEISSSGGKKSAGGNWLSVSQGIAEDASDLVSGFATIGDGLSESVDYRNEYWDSDEYEDDEDIGYVRQPIEDETWFLAHEIDYPSDHEKGTTRGSPDHHGRDANKDEDDQSYAEEASYISGEQYLQSKDAEPVSSENDRRLTVSEIYPASKKNDLLAQYDGQLMEEELLNSMREEPVWQGFVAQSNELVTLGDKKGINVHRKSHLDDVYLENDQHDSVRSIGVGINSDAADFGSEVRDSLAGGSSEGDFEYSRDHDPVASRFKQLYSESDKKHIDGPNKNKQKASKNDGPDYIVDNDSSGSFHVKIQTDGGFSFGSSQKDGQLAESSKSGNRETVTRDRNAERLSASTATDDMVATWRRKSSDSSSSHSSVKDNKATSIKSVNSSPSSLSNYACEERKHADKEDDRNDSSEVGDDNATALDDEEAVAVQEQVRQIKAQEEEFETFDLKIVHRKNRTGFEEEKNFNVVLNSVIAGRYHVTEYLGSAAFSKAIQAHDLQTGMDVCIKIIKNNKDFFDQSLDEIKLLKYVNKHDPADKYHLLRLYDYFYYREHLLIVCELLKANLYEFHKFNRESGGEVYFTMPRLQSITIQCLESLQFLHGLGLIHCDLKPENILVKSYSRCEIKVIDLGSSCFETDHLCSYVQSRSYRAPEVILGLPYDKKIDVWSLGCILAELCTGNVLFQNDSPASLLARVMGIVGSFDNEMLTKGRDSHKYFTKNRMLYERNQESNRLEYLIPKRTSLRHRLPMGDQGFTDFVAHLLEINPKKRPSAAEALKHPWLSYPYEPISA
ncbi:Protein kinase-like domain superfamily [Arabidopsis thaliana x Arabidopsis arenosa]|uniref:Protein kinase-like domain superfamily n=1 Tax=Arabidopsis thaliana x Arabidopsis arenosa TaxID=1240361 RepID=A0A8T2BKH7_9BRAS|nr:Protein kinase-like domain superfamily [Arabidopsis thaliana x Arabidopsis arenosa]KAG7586900.1 Protein kinase-like domain superfamily [Arabidopsis thaliana x Arabidopsis arenosa]KAG7586902.1 Protein kinase-like domain superfamily [Arabidopsis thaliana x Arabidopsis arenosa]